MNSNSKRWAGIICAVIFQAGLVTDAFAGNTLYAGDFFWTASQMSTLGAPPTGQGCPSNADASKTMLVAGMCYSPCSAGHTWDGALSCDSTSCSNVTACGLCTTGGACSPSGGACHTTTAKCTTKACKTGVCTSCSGGGTTCDPIVTNCTPIVTTSCDCTTTNMCVITDIQPIGVGVAQKYSCSPGYNLQALSCYTPCPDGWGFVAGVCWSRGLTSPSGAGMIACGAGIAKSKAACDNVTINQTFSVAMTAAAAVPPSVYAGLMGVVHKSATDLAIFAEELASDATLVAERGSSFGSFSFSDLDISEIADDMLHGTAGTQSSKAASPSLYDSLTSTTTQQFFADLANSAATRAGANMSTSQVATMTDFLLKSPEGNLILAVAKSGGATANSFGFINTVALFNGQLSGYDQYAASINFIRGTMSMITMLALPVMIYELVNGKVPSQTEAVAFSGMYAISSFMYPVATY